MHLNDSTDHDHDERRRGKPRKKAQDKTESAKKFADYYEIRQHPVTQFGDRNSEPVATESAEQLLRPVRREDHPNDDPKEQQRNVHHCSIRCGRALVIHGITSSLSVLELQRTATPHSIYRSEYSNDSRPIRLNEARIATNSGILILSVRQLGPLP